MLSVRRLKGNVNFFWLLRRPWELNSVAGVSESTCDQATELAAKWASTMSPILPISFLLTVLCTLGAIEGVLFRQLMFVGAALSAMVLVCSFEAWSAREIPVRSGEEREPRNRTSY
jgi:hypothetical protein